MGRIKTALIKRTTFELFEKHKGEFKPTFEENKVLVDKFAEVPSKKHRNTIAGYLTRLMKEQE